MLNPVVKRPAGEVLERLSRPLVTAGSGTFTAKECVEYAALLGRAERIRPDLDALRQRDHVDLAEIHTAASGRTGVFMATCPARRRSLVDLPGRPARSNSRADYDQVQRGDGAVDSERTADGIHRSSPPVDPTGILDEGQKRTTPPDVRITRTSSTRSTPRPTTCRGSDPSSVRNNDPNSAILVTGFFGALMGLAWTRMPRSSPCRRALPARTIVAHTFRRNGIECAGQSQDHSWRSRCGHRTRTSALNWCSRTACRKSAFMVPIECGSLRVAARQLLGLATRRVCTPDRLKPEREQVDGRFAVDGAHL